MCPAEIRSGDLPTLRLAGVLTKELRHAPYELLRTPDTDLDKINLRTVIPSHAACIKDNYKCILIMNNYRMCGSACGHFHSPKICRTVHGAIVIVVYLG